MTVAFRCQCGQKLRAKKMLAGRQTRCPKCGSQVTIPKPETGSLPAIDTGTPVPPAPIERPPDIAVAQPLPTQPAEPAPVVSQSPVPGSSDSHSSSGSVTPSSSPVPANIDLMFPCQCGQTFRVPSEFAGKQLPCPHCGAVCSIPVMIQAQGVAPTQAPMPESSPVHEVETIPQFDAGPVAPVPLQVAPRAAPSLGSPGEFAKQNIGMLIAAIAICVSAGSFGLWFLSEGLTEIAVASVAASMTKPPKQPDINSSLSAERQRQLRDDYRERLRKYMERQREQAEKRQKRVKSAENLNEVALVFLKFSHIILGLSIVAAIVGYVFCFLNPHRPGIMGVAIALTAVAALGAIFQMIFQTIPILDSKNALAAEYRGHYPLVFGWHLEVDAGDIVLAGFVDMLVFAPFILGGVLLMLIGKATGNRETRMSGLISIFLTSGFVGFLLILMILGMIEFDFESLTPLYIVWVLKWIANIAFVAGLVFLIRGLFIGRKPPGEKRNVQKRTYATNPSFR